MYGAFFGVVDLLRNPRYAVPLVINLTGSIWFFLLIGKAGEFFVVSLIPWLRLPQEANRTYLMAMQS